MRKPALLLALAALVAPSAQAQFADRPVTVAQLDQLLSADRGKSDVAVADQLAELQLTERASSLHLARWQADFRGPHTREALLALSDSSAFRDLPASDIPTVPKPDIKFQAQVLSRAIEYVSRTLLKLPNFFASRDTTQFEDLPTQTSSAGFASGGPMRLGQSTPIFTPGIALEAQPLHVIDRTSIPVTYRDGQEVHENSSANTKNSAPQELGLTTRGEFGPILGLVLADAVRGSMTWGHWEQGTDAPTVVFRYQVAQSQSHFRVTFPYGLGTVQQFPAYHGEVAIDPATGSILRLTVISDLKPPHQQVATALLVEYGPVDIGGHSYICPLHGVALSKVPLTNAAGAVDLVPLRLRTQINDVTFTHYHVFRSESHILTAAEVTPTPTSSPAAQNSLTTSVPNAAGPNLLTTSAPTTSGPDSFTATPGTPGSDPRTRVSAPASTEAPQPSATKASAESGLSVPPISEAASPPSFHDGHPTVLQANANLVLLDVVVTDHDKAVHGLDRSRFHVFENGHEQTIVDFDEHQPLAVPAATPSQLPPHTYTNVPDYPPSPALNVLLLDGLNTPLAAQTEVRRQMLEYLRHAQPGTQLAIFTLSSRLRMVTGFTTDIARLQQALQSPKAGAQPSFVMAAEGGSSMTAAASGLAAAGDADDPTTLTALVAVLQFAADVKVLETDQRVAMTLDAFQQLSRYLSAVPGRKNVIWFSGSFPLALGPPDLLPVEAQTDPLKNMRSYAEGVRKTDELLAAAHVAVYPVDARGLAAAPSSSASFIATPNLLPGAGGSLLVRRDVPKDDTSFMTQTMLEQAAMKEIASQTGGHAYLDTNGLKEAIARVVENGSSYYTVGYVPAAGKFDNQFRTIRLTLDNAKYQLAYRSGYYAVDPAKPVGAPAAAGPMHAATLLGAPPATQVLFQARILPATDRQLKDMPLDPDPAGELTATLKGPLRRYVVDLTVDPAGLAFSEASAGNRRTELQFALVAYDSETRRVNFVDRGLRLDLTAAQFSQVTASGLPLRLALDLPAGPITLRVAVYDPANGHTGSLEVPIPAASH